MAAAQVQGVAVYKIIYTNCTNKSEFTRIPPKTKDEFTDGGFVFLVVRDLIIWQTGQLRYAGG
jgi:hypothetical protein